MKQLRSVKAAALAAVLAACFLFTACGKEGAATTSSPEISGQLTETTISNTEYSFLEFPDSDVEFKYTMTLYTLVDFPQYRSLVEHYNDLNPGQAIKIEVVDTSDPAGGNSYLALMEKLAGADGPDLMVLPVKQIKDLWSHGLIDPIDEVISPYAKYDLVPAVMEYASVDDCLIALPAYISEVETCLVSEEYYSGKTWNFRDVLNCMKEHPELERTFVVQADYNADMYKNLLLFHIYDCNLSDPRYFDTATRKADFYNEDVVHLIENIGRDYRSKVKLSDYALKGKCLAQYFRTSELRDLVSRMILCCNGYNLVGIPVEQGPGNWISLPGCLAVGKNSENKEAVADFLNYVISPEGQLYMQDVIFHTDEHYIMSAPEVIGIRKDMGKYLANITAFGITDPDEFIRVYEDFVENCGIFGYEEAVYSILENEIMPYIEALDDGNPIAENIQKKAQEYLNGLE